MSDIAIRVENLSKRYHVGQRAPYRTLREVLANTMAAPFRRLGAMSRLPSVSTTKGSNDHIWALKHVSFEVKRGEVVGIIGRNGAGKTTLLKILSRVTEPTEGYAEIHGRVGSLLEVGTGFHPELSGRENIYLNGAILGMHKTEIDRKFEEIAAFAEVEAFLDTPVKLYSSGMFVRLAFAVAAHLEPEILLVDEVLAVGDAAFQSKCLGKMGDIAKQGRTVLFVSHNMRAITELCGRALWVDCGRLRREGRSDAVAQEYLSSGVSAVGWWHRPQHVAPGDRVELLAAEVSQAGRSPANVVSSAEPFHILITYDVCSRLRDCSIVLRLTDITGTVVFTSWDTDSDASLLQTREPGTYRSACHIPGHLLGPGRYTVTIAAHIYRLKVLDFQEGAFNFDVSRVGYRLNDERVGVIHPVLDWMVERL